GAPPVPVITGPAGARITVTLDNIPLGEALRYVANQAGLRVKVERYAVSVIPLSELSNELITKRYHVPPEFFGGPLDVGEYLSERVSASQEIKQATGGATQPLVSERVLDKTKQGFIAASQGGGLEGTELTQTTRQQLYNDRQLVGRATAQQYLESLGVRF